MEHSAIQKNISKVFCCNATYDFYSSLTLLMWEDKEISWHIQFRNVKGYNNLLINIGA